MSILRDKKFGIAVGVVVVASIFVAISGNGEKELPQEKPKKEYNVEEVDGKKVITPTFDMHEKPSEERIEEFKNAAIQLVKEVSNDNRILSNSTSFHSSVDKSVYLNKMFSLQREYESIEKRVRGCDYERAVLDRIEQSKLSQQFTIEDDRTVITHNRVELSVRIDYNFFDWDFFQYKWNSLSEECSEMYSQDEIVERVTELIGKHLDSSQSNTTARVKIIFTNRDGRWLIDRMTA